MLQIFHTTAEYLSCLGECQKWWAGVPHGALESSHFGISFQLQREVGWPFRGMPRSAFAPAAPVFWRKPVRTFQAPGTVLHLPVAAGIQEENCCCACRQCERLRLHFKHLLSRAHKLQQWPKPKSSLHAVVHVHVSTIDAYAMLSAWQV